MRSRHRATGDVRRQLRSPSLEGRSGLTGAPRASFCLLIQGRRTWRRIIAILFLCLAGREGFALTTQEAGENILYFEHARLSSEVCEREGTPARAAYEAWLSKNSLLQRNSVETLRTAAAVRGLSPSEQSDLVAEGLRSVTARAQEHITSHGVQCRRFAGLLEMYSKLLKR